MRLPYGRGPPREEAFRTGQTANSALYLAWYPMPNCADRFIGNRSLHFYGVLPDFSEWHFWDKGSTLTALRGTVGDTPANPETQHARAEPENAYREQAMCQLSPFRGHLRWSSTEVPTTQGDRLCFCLLVLFFSVTSGLAVAAP